MTKLTAELRFVCACCGGSGKTAEAAREVDDWGEVERLAAAHRVEGLVAGAAARLPLPTAVAERFAATLERVKHRALEDVVETLRVSRGLDRAGIRHAVIKGAPLGVQAYASPVVKQSWDVDLLVAPADAVAAAAVLGELGYAPHVPARPFTRAEFRRWSTVSKEAEFRSPAGRTVELHWRLSDHPMLLAGIGVASADKQVELFDGATVPVLEDRANLAYLAVHGALHGWSRLKWLADFAAFVDRLDADRGLIEAAQSLGTGHAIDQGLVLAHRLFGHPPHSTGAEAEALAALAGEAIDRRGAAADFDSDPAATAALRAIGDRLLPSRRYRMVRAFSRIRGSEDRRLFALPHGFGWLYWLMRPISATVRTVKRRLRPKRNRVCDRA